MVDLELYKQENERLTEQLGHIQHTLLKIDMNTDVQSVIIKIQTLELEKADLVKQNTQIKGEYFKHNDIFEKLNVEYQLTLQREAELKATNQLLTRQLQNISDGQQFVDVGIIGKEKSLVGLQTDSTGYRPDEQYTQGTYGYYCINLIDNYGSGSEQQSVSDELNESEDYSDSDYESKQSMFYLTH